MNTQAISEILTVTLNPALDYATTVPRVVANRKLNCVAAGVGPAERAPRRGVVAASATVGAEGTALCGLKTATALFHDCHVEAI
jgi:fructose-1-phosphate kinase PfkB-like protein